MPIWQALIAAERPDVIWFPAQVPETYSYTLSVAIVAGLPSSLRHLGALPERLAGHPRVSLVPWNATPAEWNAALLAAGAARTQRVTERRASPVVTEPQRYLAIYLAPAGDARAQAPRRLPR